MATITDGYDIFNTINEFGNAVYTPIQSFVDINSTVNKNTLFNTYYKIQGYNPITFQYEVWHGMGTPNYNPPSGNSLIDIELIATWQDK